MPSDPERRRAGGGDGTGAPAPAGAGRARRRPWTRPADAIRGLAALALLPVAVVVHDGTRHELAITGICGATDGGAYNVWAITPTPDEPEVALEGAPRLHAFSDGSWSRMEFYPGAEPPLVVHRDGDGRIPMTEGHLEFSGTSDGANGGALEVTLDCDT